MSLPLADYDYDFSETLIAQVPAEPRDHAGLMVIRRADSSIEHARFYEIGRYLHPGDLLVVNESRVLPARLFGRKRSGGRVGGRVALHGSLGATGRCRGGMSRLTTR